MRNKGHILILFFLLMHSATVVFAQRDSTAKAIVLAQDQDLPLETRVKQARESIDKFMLHPQPEKDPFAWYAKGYIYKEFYKTFEAQNKKSKTRLDAVMSLKKALELDTSNGKPFSFTATFHYAGEIATMVFDFDQKSIKQILKYLGSTLYNDAASLLDATNYTAAIENYEKYKECMLSADPTYNLRPKEIEFKTVLADEYSKMFLSDIKTYLQFHGMAEDLYKQVIALDTNNWAANYNLAMHYYNHGVNIINAMDAGSDIFLLDNIQEEARAQHKKALPYALKSYELNPKRKEILTCLQGIYFSLYEQEKSDEFKAKIALLEKDK